jgi:hypothetical protein
VRTRLWKKVSLALGNMDFPFDAINYEETSVDRSNSYPDGCMKIVHQIINSIMNDIMANTYDFIHLKLDLSGWRDKDELFDLRIINKESH